MLERIFLDFLFYSFVGWIWESIFCSIKARHYVYRGFLLGPYCPVYGAAITSILVLVPTNQNNLLSLFINIAVIATVVEYLASWICEKAFGMILWDYHHVPLNINGRVAIPVSLFWGLGGLILIKIINPPVQRLINDFVAQTHHLGSALLFIVFLADAASTLYFTFAEKAEIATVVDTSDPANAAIKEYRLKQIWSNSPSAPSREKILEFLQDKKETNKLRQRSFRRLVKNYPHFKFRLPK